METLVKHSEGEEVVVSGGALAPIGFKISAPNVKFKTAPSKASPKKPSALEPEDIDIGDLVHEIENLKKEEALTRISQLVDTHEVAYFKLGGVLSVINNNKFYDPYDSFDKWVENETAMKRAKARALIQIYDAIANSGITGAQVKHIGWTKLRVIARLLTKDNVLEWVEKASSHTRTELEKLVKGQSSTSRAVRAACQRQRTLSPSSSMTTKTRRSWLLSIRPRRCLGRRTTWSHSSISVLTT